MLNYFFDKFSLHDEKEEHELVIATIDKGVVFKGTNLWVLIFAIFIASLGLNVNSTAVIIGAMLVSPLMGPIMGMGLGAGINDLSLLRKALKNYLLAIAVSLTTSTIYFLLSPISDVHSELLARTSPNIYDLLIALFGGFAGILAISSKQKGNVISGVAIATALMPPLCTAGYGLACQQWTFFFGAFYLFFINSVFIGLATFSTVRLLKFPFKHLLDEKAEKRANRIIAFLLLLTLVPSIYFGYDIVQQQRFLKKANKFIENEAIIKDDYLLNKKIDSKSQTITLTYGGKEINDEEISALNSKLKFYDLPVNALKIHQGFAFLKKDDQNASSDPISIALNEKEKEIKFLNAKLDSLKEQENISKQIYTELKVNYPTLKSSVLTPSLIINDTNKIANKTTLAVFTFSKPLQVTERNKLEKWIKVRTKNENVRVIFN